MHIFILSSLGDCGLQYLHFYGININLHYLIKRIANLPIVRKCPKGRLNWVDETLKPANPRSLEITHPNALCLQQITNGHSRFWRSLLSSWITHNSPRTHCCSSRQLRPSDQILSALIFHCAYQRTTSHHILLEFSPGSELASVDFLFAFYKDNVESLRMLWSKVTIKLTLCSQDLFEGKKI